jgi:endonuclease/exonuclease/phosphatase family metal-dependent hydrolase
MCLNDILGPMPMTFQENPVFTVVLSLQPKDLCKRYSFSKEDSYSRIDFLLLSRGMAREWLPNESSVLTLPNWGLASDHRPIVAVFRDVDL